MIMVGGLLRVTSFFILGIAIAGTVSLPHIVNVEYTDIGKDYVKIKWEYDPNSRSDLDYHVAVIYRVFDQKRERVSFTKNAIKGSTEFTITELRSGTPYQIYVGAMSKETTSNFWEAALTIKTTGIRPPRTFDVREISDKTATLLWTPPLISTPDDYQIFLSNNKENKTVAYPAVAHPANEYVLWHLSPDTPYTAFLVARVKAVASTKMSMGFRTDSSLVLSTSVISFGETNVQIEWETQLATRQLIARYDIEIKDTTIEGDRKSIKMYQTTGNQEIRRIDIEDLKPVTTYRYRVRAVYRRNGGRGTWTKVDYFTTRSTTPPSAPTKSKILEKGLTSARFVWTPPVYEYTIAYYQVEYAKPKTRPFPVEATNGNNPMYLIGDLESGTDYLVKVRAVTEHGIEGPWSTEIAVTTSGPLPVASVSITEIKSTSAVIGWTKYTNSKADKIELVITQNTDTNTNHRLTTHIVNGNQTRFVVDTLQAFTPYSIKVYAIENGKTSSPKSHGLRTAGTIDIITQQPANPSIPTRGSSQSLSTLYFEFDKIPNSIVKHYVIKIQGFQVPNIPFSRTKVVVPSIGGVRQRVRIDDVVSGYRYAIKALGIFHDDSQSKWSTTVATIVPGPRPVKALGMRSITDKDITVSWESAYNKNDALFSKQQFVITLSQFGEGDKQDELTKVATKMAHSTQSEFTFASALDPVRRYQVEIVTKIAGLSAVLSTPKRRGFKADSSGNMDAPKLRKVDKEKNSLIFYWDLIPNRSDIKYYEIEFESSSTTSTTPEQIKTQNGLVDNYRFDKLDRQQIYIFKVRAVDMDDDKSEWTSRAVSLKHGLTDQMAGIRTSKVTGNSATLSWDVPLTTNLKMYEIEISRHGDVKLITTKVLTSDYKVEDLHLGTEYRYRVRAVGTDESEKGPWSNYQTFSTEKTSSDTAFSTGVIAGIAVAGVIVFILLIILIMVCCKNRRSNKSPKAFNVHFKRNDTDMKEIE